jgi:hypothetical protein
VISHTCDSRSPGMGAQLISSPTWVMARGVANCTLSQTTKVPPLRMQSSQELVALGCTSTVVWYASLLQRAPRHMLMPACATAFMSAMASTTSCIMTTHSQCLRLPTTDHDVCHYIQGQRTWTVTLRAGIAAAHSLHSCLLCC